MTKQKEAPVKPPKWATLREDNNWGSITVRYSGKDKKPFDHRKPELLGEILVQFPDGTEHVVKFRMRSVVEHISDMGRSYDVSSEVPYIIFDFHGLPVDVRLSNSRLKVKVV